MPGSIRKVLAAAAALTLATGVASAQTPKRGGTLNFSVVAEPPNYDCHGSTTFALIHPIAPGRDARSRPRRGAHRARSSAGRPRARAGTRRWAPPGD